MLSGMARIAIIGGGSIGEALLSGLLRAGRQVKDLVVAERMPERAKYLADTYSVRVASLADAVDNAFITALKAKGIDFASPQAAIVAGHEVCDELDLGRQKSDIANDVMGNSKMDGYHAGFFVGASVAAYCPRHLSAA